MSLSGDLWNESGIALFDIIEYRIETDFEMRQILFGLICYTDNRYTKQNIKKIDHWIFKKIDLDTTEITKIVSVTIKLNSNNKLEISILNFIELTIIELERLGITRLSFSGDFTFIRVCNNSANIKSV